MYITTALFAYSLAYVISRQVFKRKIAQLIRKDLEKELKGKDLEKEVRFKIKSLEEEW